MDGRHPARDRHQLRRRGALRRNAVARELVDDQLQRNEHPRERLPQRVPRRAGKSAGQHRRGPRRYVCLHRRAWNGAAPDHLCILPGFDWRQEQPCGVHVDELHEQHVPDAAGDLQSQSHRVCQQPLRRRDPSHERGGGRGSGELLPRQSGPPGRRRPHDKCRIVGVSRAATRTATALCPGPAVRGQLCLRPGDGERLPELPPADCHAP